jgi:16S rRNA (uracil1498-N3)-methyltransferase
MRRFLIPSSAVSADTVTLSGDLFHHIVHVLRLHRGTRLCLADEKGREYEGRIRRVDADSLTVSVEGSHMTSPLETGPRITLFQGLPKGDKLDFVIQKCTELGVSRVVPFIGERSVARPPERRIQDKLERWRRIAMEAARQSNRLTAPTIDFANDLSEICRSSDHDVKILLWEEEKTLSLKTFLAGAGRPGSVAVIIGPEGGLSVDEVSMAYRCGFNSVSIGKRILRTETAGMALLAILQFHWGDIG